MRWGHESSHVNSGSVSHHDVQHAWTGHHHREAHAPAPGHQSRLSHREAGAMMRCAGFVQFTARSQRNARPRKRVHTYRCMPGVHHITSHHMRRDSGSRCVWRGGPGTQKHMIWHPQRCKLRMHSRHACAEVLAWHGMAWCSEFSFLQAKAW